MFKTPALSSFFPPPTDATHFAAVLRPMMRGLFVATGPAHCAPSRCRTVAWPLPSQTGAISDWEDLPGFIGHFPSAWPFRSVGAFRPQSPVAMAHV
jgi:hypothetical protein